MQAGRPQRSTEEWRPEPLLCKRFNVPDPFKGRARLPVPDTHFSFDTLAQPDTDAAAAQAASNQLLPGPPPASATAGALPPAPVQVCNHLFKSICWVIPLLEYVSWLNSWVAVV